MSYSSSYPLQPRSIFIKTAMICCFSSNEISALTKKIQVASCSRDWHYTNGIIYIVEVEFFETSSQIVAMHGHIFDKSLEPPSGLSQQLIRRRSFIRVDPQHTPQHVLALLGNIPEPSFLEPQENYIVLKVHDLNLWTSLCLLFAIIGGYPHNIVYSMTPQLHISLLVVIFPVMF